LRGRVDGRFALARWLTGQLAIDPHEGIDESIMLTTRGELRLGVNRQMGGPYNRANKKSAADV